MCYARDGKYFLLSDYRRVQNEMNSKLDQLKGIY